MQKIFPIWGTCLGFEVMFMLTKGSTDVLEQCKGYNFATELIFMPGETKFFVFIGEKNLILSLDANDSRLFGPSLPKNIRDALQNESTTSNYHDFCMRPEVTTFTLFKRQQHVLFRISLQIRFFRHFIEC